MKKLKTIIALMLCMGILLNLVSCAVFYKKDNGNHNGWYKNHNNPHNPNSTNPGKSGKS